MSKEAFKKFLAYTATVSGLMAATQDRLEDEREYWKLENAKREKEYRKSKEFRDIRAKKKANRKLRKKSQGR